jgi:uncharacterized coiled-coil protein SlyX
MQTSAHPRRAAWLITSLMLLAAPLGATEGGFSATLSTGQQVAAGLGTLTTEERRVLDRLVAAEVGLARQETLAGLDGTFASRRSEADRQQAGLDRLMPEQLAALNDLVAAAIAPRPAPKERRRLKESDVVAAKPPPEIHGSVSVTYGWGANGEEFRASSLWLEFHDPGSPISLGVGLSTYDGDGYYGYTPGYYPGPWDYYGPPVYPAPRVYLDAATRGDFGRDFFKVDGASLRGVERGDFSGHGGRR